MGRNRSRSLSRSRSYSPRRSRSRSRSRSPPRRKQRYDDYRERDRFRGFRDRRSSAPTGLLVRNISLDARPEDLRIPFERFGPVKDVYLPRNYYTGEPRGFGFVKYRNPDDAAEAKYHMNHQIIGGREITIVFAEENRKNPQEMRANARHGRSSRYGEGGFRRRSPPRSPRRRRRSYSRSPSPPKRGSRGHGIQEDYYSDARSFSRSPIACSESRSPRAADVRRPIVHSESRSPRAADIRRPINRSESRSPRVADARRPIARNESRSPRAADVRNLHRASSLTENGRSPIRRQMPMQASSPR